MTETKEFRDELLKWSRHSSQPKKLRKMMEMLANGLVDSVDNFPKQQTKPVVYDYTYNKDWLDEKAKITVSPKTRRVQIHINNKFNKYKDIYRDIAKQCVEYWIQERGEILTVRGVIDFKNYNTISFRTENVGPNGRKTQFRVNIITDFGEIEIKEV